MPTEPKPSPSKLRTTVMAVTMLHGRRPEDLHPKPYTPYADDVLNCTPKPTQAAVPVPSPEALIQSAILRSLEILEILGDFPADRALGAAVSLYDELQAMLNRSR